LFRVLTCIAGQHDLRLVLVAGLICVTAAFTAFRLYSNARLRSPAERTPWLAFTALAAGCGVWATHFVAMLAYAPAVRSGYEPAGTALSLAISIACSGLFFGFASAARKRLWLGFAGAGVGLSIGVMHYAGMAAYRPSAVMIWDYGYVAASVVIGVGLSIAALFVAGKGPKNIWIAAGLYTVAVCGLHFTAMSAVTLLPDPAIPAPAHALSNGTMAAGVTGAAALILLMAASLVSIESWTRKGALAHLREAIEPMGEGIAFFDADDRAVVWNSRYAELVDPAGGLKPGISFRELLEINIGAGAHPEAVGHEDEWLDIREANRRRLGGDEHRNGDRWIRAERRRTRDGGLVTVCVDVTEFRRATEVLAQARDAAEAANRAKSEFLANVSHELRTPLNGVLGIAEVLASTPLNERQQEMVDTIRASGATLDELVSDIIELARLEAGKASAAAEPFDLGPTMEAVASPYRLQARKKKIGFSLEIAPEAAGRVLGDAQGLRQILSNLLSNAVKFTDHGEVRLTVERPDPTGGRIRFVVHDTGIGFDQTFKAHIFERFQQMDGSSTRRHGGSGLGLAISKQAAGLMGGELDCESAPGQGSAFTLTLELPLEGASKAMPAPEAAAVAPEDTLADPLPLKVLVVDDHPTNRRVVEMILDTVGAERVSVENGQEALEAYINERFDVVLMDIQMPVMDGLTATQKIRLMEKEEHRPSTPVIILSANAMPEHIAAGRAAGADRHLAKPISAAALLNVIAEVAYPGPKAAA
jgi:signal transduction histidine kinase/NO-binding membrane sensor protein with MHYT domain/CheY-like chemotaxis protein